MTPPQITTKEMSDTHKAALAEGRKQGRAVRAYLEALETNKPKRGRKRTPESIQKRLDRIDIESAQVDPLKRLQITQEKIDLQAELERMDANTDLVALEKDFIDVAADYAERKGISYGAFRELDVSAAVLKRAGITRRA
ncbi:MAG: DNA replication initiation complex subunit (GINS family) [Acidimicrobiales bacterium]|jgi:DNA replication initiation complex subunit (GINS family)